MKEITRILPIRLDRLNNDEYAQFLRGTANLISAAGLENLAITEQVFSDFIDSINALTESTRQSRVSKETKDLKDLDKKRNELSVFLLSSFRLERKSPIAERRDSGDTLYVETKNYIGLQGLPIRQKSNVISALVKDLLKSKNIVCINSLGLLKVVRELEEVNIAYQKLIEGRAESQVENNIVSAKKIRATSDAQYETMMDYAFAMNVIHPSKESSNFVVYQNKLIEDTNNAFKQRKAQIGMKQTGEVSEVKPM